MISTNIKEAVFHLNQDQIVGLPTETVYGLAGNAFSEKAIQSIFTTKKRPSFNPLIVHIKSLDDLPLVATDIPDLAWELAKAFWPGSLTLILPKQPHISDTITAGKPTVAVRVPKHPMALELLAKLDFPLVAPSANPFGSISPTKAIHVENYFGDQISLVLDGGSCEAGVESTIIGFEKEKVQLYRYGAVPLEAIEKITGKVTVFNKSENNPKAPGMLLKHYAPKTDFLLSRTLLEDIDWYADKKVGALLFHQPITNLPLDQQIVLASNGDFETAAARLYDAMHELDSRNFDIIIAERFPDYGLGCTINDRLERATHKTTTHLKM